MTVIGFRAEADRLIWIEMTGTAEKPEPSDHETYKLASNVELHEALALLRTHVDGLLKEVNPTRIAIRTAEHYHQMPSHRPTGNKLLGALMRARIEGIVFLAAGERRVPTIWGNMQTLSSRIGGEHSAKEYRGLDDFRGVPFPAKSEEVREAFLAAVAALGD